MQGLHGGQLPTSPSVGAEAEFRVYQYCGAGSLYDYNVK